MAYKSPQDFYDRWIGKSVDVDGYYGAQCWDGKAKFLKDEGIPVSTYCKLTGYAGDLYKLRYEYGYDKYFDFFYPRHAKKGDWIYWDQHVAMVWDVDLNGDRVLCFGQNQGGKKYFTLKWYKLSTALGCMRYRKWMNMNGWHKEDGNWYFYRDGKKVTGWQKLTWSGGEDWFFFDSNGAMVTGWRLITYKGKKEWFWFDDKGVMAENILRWVKNNWYYFDADGVMVTGEIGLTLEFDSSGRLIGGRK